MADSILARLRGEVTAVAQNPQVNAFVKTVANTAFELSTAKSESDFANQVRPLNIQPEFPRAQFQNIQPPPAFIQPPQSDFSNLKNPVVGGNAVPAPRLINRPSSIMSSVTYFGEQAVDQLLGYRNEASANSIALREEAALLRKKRGFFIISAILCMAASTGLSVSPVCDFTNITCVKNNFATIAALCGASACFLSVALKISAGTSSGSLDSLAEEWAQLARVLHEALFLSPPTGDSVSAGTHVRRWALQHQYIADRTPIINPDRKKRAMLAAQRLSHGNVLLATV